MRMILEKYSTVLLASVCLLILTGNTFGEPAAPDATRFPPISAESSR